MDTELSVQKQDCTRCDENVGSDFYSQKQARSDLHWWFIWVHKSLRRRSRSSWWMCQCHRPWNFVAVVQIIPQGEHAGGIFWGDPVHSARGHCRCSSASDTGTNSGSRKEHCAGAGSAASQSRCGMRASNHRSWRNCGGDSSQGERLHDTELWPGATDHGGNRGRDHWHDGSDDPSYEHIPSTAIFVDREPILPRSHKIPTGNGKIGTIGKVGIIQAQVPRTEDPATDANGPGSRGCITRRLGETESVCWTNTSRAEEVWWTPQCTHWHELLFVSAALNF